MNQKTLLMSPIAMAALWFGAAVSMAEILTGGLLAGMDRSMAITAIIGGHLIGAVIFFAVARLSWKTDRGAIEVCKDTFGRPGTVLFGSLNVVQLVGWTAIMIITGADGMDRMVSALGGPHVTWLWKLALGAFLLVWIVSGLRHDSLINKIAALLLLLLTVGIALWIFGGKPLVGVADATTIAPMSFGSGFELVLIMPLSWLPLVGDYTRPSVARKYACIIAAIAYAVGSSWMYLVGFGSFAATGNADPLGGLLALAGPVGGLIGLLVIILSTVTTAFLDVRSAGLSAKTVVPAISDVPASIVMTIIGIILAILLPIDQYQNFLYIIGSMFAPLYAVLLASSLLKRWQTELGPILRGGISLGAWAIGMVLYYLLLPTGTLLGVSIPIMAAVAIIYIVSILGVVSCKKLAFQAR